jgi:RimJ/RimL family protein N-acetyltransferase
MRRQGRGAAPSSAFDDSATPAEALFGERRADCRMVDAPILHGDGFVLRAVELSDAEAWKQGEDAEQIRWFEAPGPAPMENIVAAIERWQHGWRGGPVRHWGIWVDGQLGGGVELRVREDGIANISYVVFPFARRRGVASGAARLASSWALSNLGVPAVVAVIDELNTASRAVAERAGFRLDGNAEPWEYGETGTMLRYILTPPATARP